MKWFKITYQPLTVVCFATMLLLTIFSMVYTGQVYPHISTFTYMLLGAMIIFSAISNIADIKGLSQDNLSVREPFSNFEPLLGGLIAFLIFPAERNITILIFVIIGTLTLFLANVRKSHFILDGGKRFFVYSILCEAILMNLYVVLLQSLSEVWVFFFRMLGVFIVTAIVLRFKLSQFKPKQYGLMILSGAAYFIGSLAYLYSITEFGLLTTIVLLMLLPTFKYLGSYLILNEKFSLRQISASAILTILVLLTIFL